MFSDLLGELGKMEASVRGAFADVEGRIRKQRTRIETIEASLLDPLGRVEAIATKAETTVKGRMGDLRAASQRLFT